MADRLRDLLDLVLSSLDDDVDGAALAQRAHFSRDHLDRLVAAATGESPVALRRRLLLERAAWQLRAGVPPAEAAALAGYGSVAAFSRAFSRAYGAPPSAYDGDVQLAARNGIHFHPPAGLLIPGAPASGDLTERMVAHHLDRVRELLRAASALEEAELARELRPGLVLVWFEGEEPSAALMCERLVYTLEVWVAAIDGREVPAPREGAWLPRFERAAKDFARIAKRIRDRGAYDDAFVDALCEPPQSFTYGGVLSHVLAFGAVRREALAGVLVQLGADVSCGDPIVWEAAHR
ncbi:AraC-like DNA-binding protein [Solirubrobacter pauli]|uniref:AraC-like DNA-binding protein n=1 Tax=Solirubrobacter pauli TaxID=166793 RepID=A0A660LAT1_9ACTN|nr:AraC family transcriptional regulator [Solirubrobacter pauli]RKQ92108.1 AraC-like DNA-binding protein [Solirubrobacter pauli]